MKFKAKIENCEVNPQAILEYETWLGYPENIGLPLTPEDYKVEQIGEDRWSVTDPTGSKVYSGIGPVKVLAS